MANKKTEEDQTGLVPAVDSALDLMVPAQTAIEAAGDGLGSEDIGAGDIILPRVTVLQPMSKACTEDLPGAKPGALWLTPHGRPLTKGVTENLKFIIARIFPAWRRWTPLDQGGGIECEAGSGNLTASAPNGLAGARLEIDTKGEPQWIGGHPTNRCFECVFGPGAAASAGGGKPDPTRPGNGWLPKMIGSTKLDDKARRPKCTQSVDVLALVAVPAIENKEAGINLPGEIMPAFLSFFRTGLPAGRSLAGMVKMQYREPAWAKIYQFGTKKVTNDSGTFFIPTVSVLGFTQKPMADRAQALYEQSKVETFAPSLDDVAAEGGGGGGSEPSGPTDAPADDAPAPKDTF